MLETLTLFAQRTGGGGGEAEATALLVTNLCVCGFQLIFVVLMIASLWKVFDKAGEPGWAAIIPIYNAVVLCRVAGKPEWWVLLLLIPFVNIVVGIIVALGVAENFGKSGAFAIGLILLPFIFYPILGFGSAQYQGKGGSGGNYGRRRSRRDDYDDEDA
jgi:hypothetical protein